MARKYRKVAVGGTFDLLHKGHIRLIERALEVGDFVAIGVTSDQLLEANPKSHFVAKFDERREELLNYLKVLRVLDRVQIVPLDDAYGTTIDDGELEALVASYETAGMGEEINEIRRRKGFKPLRIVTLDAVLAEDGLPISTTRIRRGEIDREGHLLRGRRIG